MSSLFMKGALVQARHAQDRGEVPVGAVLVHQGQIIAASGNCVLTDQDPTAHAEILCLRAAGRLLQTTHLTTCDLYVTLEPCPMCAGAIALSRIRRLVFGAFDPKSGGVDHGPRIFQQHTCHHHPEVIGGVLETTCAKMMQDFFARKR